MPAGHSGMGTTLSANALAVAAMRATLEHVMTPESYARMDVLAGTLAAGLIRAIDHHGLPWHVVRVGARVEFICAPGPLHDGTQAEAAHAPALEQAIHLALLNRGCLIAPFHNMMLVCPATTAAQVETLRAAFDEVAGMMAS
jgi:glutamate-1-semialdehyde 2,1-aminomutase